LFFVGFFLLVCLGGGGGMGLGWGGVLPMTCRKSRTRPQAKRRNVIRQQSAGTCVRRESRIGGRKDGARTKKIRAEEKKPKVAGKGSKWPACLSDRPWRRNKAKGRWRMMGGRNGLGLGTWSRVSVKQRDDVQFPQELTSALAGEWDLRERKTKNSARVGGERSFPRNRRV